MCVIDKCRITAKKTILAGSLIGVAGCFGIDPVTYTTAKLAIDGLSYVSTGKGTADHAMSAVTGKDCNMIRVFKKNRDVCERWYGKTILTASQETLADYRQIARLPAQPVSSAASEEETGNDGTPYFSLWAPQH